MADISTAVSRARVPILGEDGRISDKYIPKSIPQSVEAAEAAAKRAETAATAAKGSATAASQSATGAQGSASAASASATKAQQSATAANEAVTQAQSAQKAAEAAKTGGGVGKELGPDRRLAGEAECRGGCGECRECRRQVHRFGAGNDPRARLAGHRIRGQPGAHPRHPARQQGR